MKTLRHFASFAIIALLLTGFISSARAETTACPKALKPDDCTLLSTAGKNLDKLTTFVADYQIYGQLTGLTPAPTTITLNGKAPFSVKQDAANLVDAVRSLSFQTTTLGSLNTNNLVYGLALAIRTIDGNLYEKGVAVSGSQGFTKISLPAVFSALAQKDFPGIGDISQPGVHLLGGLIDPNLPTSLAALESVPGLVKITRQAGSFIDNQPTTQVTATFDMPTLFKYLLGDGIETMKDVSNTLGISMTQLDLSDAQTAAGIKQSSLAVTWYYGSKDQLYHGFSFTSSFRFQGKASSLMGGNGTKPVTLRANLSVRLSQIGKPVTVQDVTASEVAADGTDAFLKQVKLK